MKTKLRLVRCPDCNRLRPLSVVQGKGCCAEKRAAKRYTKAHVVAWEYEGGGGFDWYFNAADALKAFETEKKNCRTYKSENWHAISFVFSRKKPMTAAAMTRSIALFIHAHDEHFHGIMGNNWPRFRTDRQFKLLCQEET